MKTITTLSIEEYGITAALFFILWNFAQRLVKTSTGISTGGFMESYYIRLPFKCIIQYGKHSRQERAMVSICKIFNQHDINNGCLK